MSEVESSELNMAKQGKANMATQGEAKIRLKAFTHLDLRIAIRESPILMGHYL